MSELLIFANFLFFGERCEWIAHFAQIKWAIVSELIRSLTKTSEWVNCSFFSANHSYLLGKPMSEFPALGGDHRRRIKTEEKANLFNSSTCLLFCTGRFKLWDEFHQDDLNWKNDCILFFKIVPGKIASTDRNLINSYPPPPPPTRSDDLCLFFCLYPSSMVGTGEVGIVYLYLLQLFLTFRANRLHCAKFKKWASDAWDPGMGHCRTSSEGKKIGEECTNQKVLAHLWPHTWRHFAQFPSVVNAVLKCRLCTLEI